MIVDDELDIREILSFNLEAEGFDVASAASAEEALTMMASGTRPDLILLDVMMEHMSGFDMARHLRNDGNTTPIIFLTALADEPNLLQGFGTGADDYVSKPFSFSTVLARIRAVLRRSSQSTPQPDNRPISIDPATGIASVYGIPTELTRKELMILQLLCDNPGTYFSREAIIEHVWGDTAYICDRGVDVHIARLRKKLGPAASLLRGKTGFGYRIEQNQ